MRVPDPVLVGRLEPSEWLGRIVRVVVDRPLGSLHPNGSFRYEHNYGYLPGFLSPDGEELDAYILGPTEPVDEQEGVVLAVVLREDDIEDKLVVGAPDTWTRDEIAAAVRFQEQFFESVVVTET